MNNLFIILISALNVHIALAADQSHPIAGFQSKETERRKINISCNPAVTLFTEKDVQDFSDQKIQEIHMSLNQIVEITPQISKLQDLQILCFSFNEITKIPESIGYLRNLKRLLFTGNKITEVPDTLYNLVNLEVLALNENKISSLPKGISKLSQLKKLLLSGNALKKLPDDYKQLSPVLEQLTLHENQFTKDDIKKIKNNLKRINSKLVISN